MSPTPPPPGFTVVSDALAVAVRPVTPFQQNASVALCRATGHAALVDPGGELDELEALCAADGVELEAVLLTHGHADHASAAAEAGRRFGVPVVGPEAEDRFWLESLPQQAAMFGLGLAEAVEPDRWLAHGETVQVGALELEVLHCPGHTPGHVAYFHRASRFAWVGDVLFHGSIGRTDFPRGDLDTLLASIRERLLPLGDDVTFLPGHGPTSTFGVEREGNPFLVARR